MNLENSLKSLVIVNLFLGLCSVTLFLAVVLAPIFGFILYQIWQSLESFKRKTQIKCSNLFFKLVKLLYLSPIFLGIISLVLLAFGSVF